jgi:hypothetical protein
LAQHLKRRLAQGDNALLVAFAGDLKQHLSRVDCRNRKPRRFTDA